MGDWTDLLPQPGKGSGIPEFSLEALNGQSARSLNDAQAQVFKAKLTAGQQQQARDQEYNLDAQAYYANPTAAALAKLAIKYPDHAEQLKQAYSLMDADARTSRIGQYSGLLNAATNNRVDLVKKQIQDIRYAEQAAKIDTSEVDDILAQFETNPAAAMKYVTGFARMHLSAADPVKFPLPGANTEGKVVGNSIGHYDGPNWVVDYTAPSAPQRPISVPVYDENGRRVGTRLVTPDGGATTGAGGSASPPAYSGGPVSLDTLRPLFSAQESGGSYTARNPDTGAMGRWQVMPGTGAKLAKRLGLEWRPDMMLHDRPEDRQYQDKIGEAAMAEAVAVAKGDPAKAFSYYYSGSTSAYLNPKGNPKTAQYVSEMMTRLAGGDPRAKGGAPPQGSDGAGGYYGPVPSPQSGSSTDPSLSGDAFLATLPPSQQAAVKAIAEGRAAPPRPGSRNGEALLDAVTRYDPTFDAANAQSRVRTRVDFTSGKSAQNITAMNTSMGHLIQLDSQAKKLGNWSFAPGILNPSYNAARRVFGNTSLDAFDQTKRAVASEMRKVFAGAGGGTLEELKGWEASLDDSKSYDQLHAVIANGVGLLESRLRALEQQYTGGMGRSDRIPQFIKPGIARMADKLFSVDLGSSAPGRSPSAPGSRQPTSARGTQANPIAVATRQQLLKLRLPSGTWVRLPDGRVVPTR